MKPGQTFDPSFDPQASASASQVVSNDFLLPAPIERARITLDDDDFMLDSVQAVALVPAMERQEALLPTSLDQAPVATPSQYFNPGLLSLDEEPMQPGFVGQVDTPKDDFALGRGVTLISLEPTPAVAPDPEPQYYPELLEFTFEPSSISKADLNARPLLDVASDRRYQFTDPATPAILAAIPQVMGNKETVVSYGQLRGLASNVLQSLNDMQVQEVQAIPAAPTSGLDEDSPEVAAAVDRMIQDIPQLPSGDAIRDRVDRIILELRSGSPGLMTPPYLQEIPRTNPAFDALDKSIRMNGFPAEWKDALGSDIPPVTFRLTPEGRAVGELVQARSADPVVGFGFDRSEVKLPTPLAQIAFAGADARGEMRLDYYDAGLMGPGDLGREIVLDAYDLRANSSGLDVRDADVTGGRVIDLLDTASLSAGYVANTEELETPVANFAIRPAELKDTLLLARDAVAANPVLATDEFVNERFSQAMGTYQGLKVLEQAKARAASEGLKVLLRPETYQLGPDDLDLRPGAGAEGVEASFLANGVNPRLADRPLGNEADAITRRLAFVESWIVSSANSKDQADFLAALYRGTREEVKASLPVSA